MVKRIRRVFNAFADTLAAALEAKATELKDYSRNYNERQYWQGYSQGVQDARSGDVNEGAS
jgi:hypothetical protein